MRSSLRYVHAAILATLVSALAACGANGPTTIEIIGKAPPERTPGVGIVQVGPEARHAVWISSSAAGGSVAIDGSEGKVYSWIEPAETHSAGDANHGFPVKFSEDGRHTAYVGGAPQADSFVVVDGKEGAPWNGIVQYLTFSPDSVHVVYGVQVNRSGTGQAWMIVIDGPDGMKKLPASGPEVAFSADGKHMAYCGGADFRDQIAIEDGQPINTGSDTSFRKFKLSPDGKRFAYEKGVPQEGAPGLMRYVCDGVESDVYDQEWQCEFSPDSSKFVCIGLHNLEYKARNEGRVFNFSLAINGKEIGKYSSVDLPVFSSGGTRMAYRARADVAYAPGSFIVVDGVADKPHDAIGLPVFSPDGKHIAYAVERDKHSGSAENSFIVQDGTNLPAHDRVFTPVFSPDGQHLAYRILDENKTAAKFPLRFSIVMDGSEQAPYDQVSDPVFSADSKHLAYCAMRGKQAFIVADGKESDPFDAACGDGTVFFDSTTHVHCLGVKDGMIVRVTKEVP